MLKIYPTSRSIRDEYKNYTDKNAILPKIITIGEFEQKVVILERNLIDEDSRILYLNDASNFENFSRLNIDRDFFRFIKNSTYLLRFFDETANELVDIDEFFKYDTYETYEKDLTVLKTLLENYKKILKLNSKTDRIFLPNEYEINYEYLKSITIVELKLEGYLTNFEFGLFGKIAKEVEFRIKLSANEFNKKMLDKFDDLELEIGYDYEIDLSSRVVVNKKKTTVKSQNIEINSFESRLLQISNIKRKIYDYVKKGIEPSSIALVVPDENFISVIKDYDTEKYFNFAMGFGFGNSRFFTVLLAIESYLEEKNPQNRSRVERLDIDQELLNDLDLKWNNKIESREFFEIIKNISQNITAQEETILHEEIFKYQKVLNQIGNYPFNKIYHLFLSRLKKRNIDDKSGGKITVIGVLESRAVEYEAVIIVDFNEEIVPKKSKKDLFLSSELRARVGMPTLSDRENLQKYYYKRLIDGAKEVSISFVQSDTMQPSRFLEELKLTNTKKINQIKTLDILYDKRVNIRHFEKDELILEYNFLNSPISSSRLKLFLECKRKFYFRYIKRLKEFELPKENSLDSRKIGITLHLALKELYSMQNHYFDSKTLLNNLKNIFNSFCCNDLFLKYQLDIWYKKLESFSKQEIERFKQGYRVKFLEREFFSEYGGFKLKGIIDRVDEKEGKITIIDYKSGKIKEPNKKNINATVDFQLEFYYLLLRERFNIDEIYYYDLPNQKPVLWSFGDEKLALLEEVFESLKQKEFNFSKCEELTTCRYCEYSTICNRI